MASNNDKNTSSAKSSSVAAKAAVVAAPVVVAPVAVKAAPAAVEAPSSKTTSSQSKSKSYDDKDDKSRYNNDNDKDNKSKYNNDNDKGNKDCRDNDNDHDDHDNHHESSSNKINGTPGNDVIEGTNGKDYIKGNSGDDTINGGAGNDKIQGNNGNDILNGGAGSDSLHGGNGNDFFVYNVAENKTAEDKYDGGGGTDTLQIQITRAVYDSASFQADLARWNAQIAKPNGENKPFQFKTFDLEIKNIEKIEFKFTDGGTPNEAPKAVADALSITEDSAASTINVLANDTDPNAGDVLSVSSINTTGVLGQVTLVNGTAGTISYNPGTLFNNLSLNETRTETFAYTVIDNKGGSATANVTVTIRGVNDIPLAQAVSAAVVAGSTVSGQLLADDVDNDDSATTLNYSLVTAPTLGAVTFAGNQFVYDTQGAFNSLQQGQVTTVSFSYKATDSHGAASNVATASITVTGKNFVPTLDLDANNSSGKTGNDFYTKVNAGPIAIIDSDVAVSDTNSADLMSKVTVAIDNYIPNEGDILYLNNSYAGISSTFDAVTGMLTITGNASASVYQSLLSNIRFDNIQDNLDNRNFTVTLYDQFGGASAAAHASFVLNYPTFIDLDSDDSSGANGESYLIDQSAGGPFAIVDQDMLVEEIDGSLLSKAVIRIQDYNPQTDYSLSVGNTHGLQVIFNAQTGVLTVLGNASADVYADLLKSVRYNAPSDASAVRETTFEINLTDDMGLSSNVATATLAPPVVPNLAPIVDLDADDSSGATGYDYSMTINPLLTTSVAIADADIQITDPNGDLISKLVITTLNFAEGDLLRFTGNDTHGLSYVYDTTVGLFTVSGIGQYSGENNWAEYSDFLSQIEYQRADQIFEYDRVFGIQVFDSENLSSESGVARIVIRPDNVAPVIDLDSNNSTDNGLDYSITLLASQVDAFRFADSDFLITELNQEMLSQLMIKAFYVDPSISIGFDEPDARFIETYNAETGVFTLSGLQSAEVYMEALQNLHYFADSANPLNNIFEITVTDQTGLTSISAFSRANFIADPLALNLDLDADDSSNFYGGDYSATVTGLGPFAITDVDVRISGENPITSAVISIIGFTEGSAQALLFDGNSPLHASFDATLGTLTLTGLADHSVYEDALHHVYYNPSGLFDLASLSVWMTDSAGAEVAATSYLFGDLHAVNQAPIIDLNAQTVETDLTYTFNGRIDTVNNVFPSYSMLTDADSTQLSRVEFRILNLGAGDKLDAAFASPLVNELYDAGTGLLILSGQASVADYATLMHSVIYDNVLGNYSDKQFSIKAFDSNGAASQVAVMSMLVDLNSHPTLDLDLDNSTALGNGYQSVYLDSSATAVKLSDTDIRLVDPEGDYFVSASIRMLTQASADHFISVNTQLYRFLDVSYDSLTGTLHIAGDGPAFMYQNLLATAQYKTLGDALTSNTFEFQLTDSTGSVSVSSYADLFFEHVSAPVNYVPLDAASGNDWIVGDDFATRSVGDPAHHQAIAGHEGNDLLDGGIGHDQYNAGAGDDLMVFDTFDFSFDGKLSSDAANNLISQAHYDGGEGFDTVQISANLEFDFSRFSDAITHIEKIDLSLGDTNGASISLGLQDVLNMSETTQLFIDGDSHDTVKAEGFVSAGVQVVNDVQYHVYTQDAASLLIHSDIHDIIT